MLKPKVILTRVFNREMDVIKISFERNEAIMNCLRCLKNLRWSQTLRAWYVPNGGGIGGDIFKLLRDISFIDYSDIKHIDNLPGS